MEIGFDELYEACAAVVSGDHAQARHDLARLLPETVARGPRWMEGLVRALLADTAGRAGDLAEGMEHFRAAVAVGWNDCVAAVREPGLAALTAAHGYRDVYRRIAVSPADLEELRWIHAERACVDHDTMLMIGENAGRKDSSATEVPQCALPTRTPDGLGVPAARAMLRTTQRTQLASVLTSDTMRRSHVTSMSIIANMGSSPFGGSGFGSGFGLSPAMEAASSQALANSRAATRREAVWARAFCPTIGLSNSAVPAPERP
ncbi:hypothetical protein [Actinocorallia sp. A-T 12471]|uniref:hypothetical protein n=1 Tax=Actinocorallia sp. A-T 12471 TaxID=3089813 RepID=UPI0029D06AAF|nr:hypothetical protein [Actinocorallia sp. A-T 12471]MDX6742112.1 hypothetical protein [Actinocorallia sp. A-T 12471]